MRKVFKNSVYEGDMSGNIPDGNGTFEFNNGDKYVGEIKQGKLCGKGIYYFRNGNRYEGEFDNNSFSGSGTTFFANGSKHTGLYKNGKRDGLGTFFYENGDVYTGGFSEGKRSGHGKIVYSDGSSYDGGFLNNEKTGFGVFTDTDGIQYEGEFSGEDIIGEAYVSFSDGGKVIGTFKNGAFSAKKCIYSNGDIYEGNFENNVPSGEGAFFYTDGSEYLGEVRDNLRNGKGVLRYKNGNSYLGNFVNDIREGHGTFTFADGKKYVGEFKKGNYNGTGTFFYKSGNIYQGEFKDGVREGIGVMSYIDGQRYMGEYKADKICGRGKYYFSGGDWYDGEWDDNKMNGEGVLYVGKEPEEVWENGTYDLRERYCGRWKDGKKEGRFIHYKNNIPFDELFSEGKKVGCPIVCKKDGVKEDLTRRSFVLRHGGQNAFFIETASAILIFDWYRYSLPYIRQDKPIYIFISSKAPECFNPEIFALTHLYENVSVFMGYDRSDRIINGFFEDLPDYMEDSISCFSGETKLNTDFGTVHSLDSGEDGVAFLVEIDGMKLFHAGALKFHGENEKILSLGEEASFSVTDFTKNKRLSEERFRNYAAGIKGLCIDYAMLPLDPRFGSTGEKAVAYFNKIAAISLFSPMSLWGNYEYITHFAEANPALAKKMISSAPDEAKILSPIKDGKGVFIDLEKKIIKGLEY